MTFSCNGILHCLGSGYFVHHGSLHRQRIVLRPIPQLNYSRRVPCTFTLPRGRKGVDFCEAMMLNLEPPSSQTPVARTTLSSFLLSRACKGFCTLLNALCCCSTAQLCSSCPPSYYTHKYRTCSHYWTPTALCAIYTLFFFYLEVIGVNLNKFCDAPEKFSPPTQHPPPERKRKKNGGCE